MAQMDFNGLMVGDEVSLTELGHFGAAPNVFVIKSVGGNKNGTTRDRWISPVGEPNVQPKDRIFERDGYRVEIIKH